MEGENFESEEVENKHYNLVYDALELQDEIFGYLIIKYDADASINKDTAIISQYLDENNTSNRNLTIKTMLSKMQKSLDDKEIGSVIKVKNEKGKYIRQYPENWD